MEFHQPPPANDFDDFPYPYDTPNFRCILILWKDAL